MLFETTYKYAGFDINAATDSEGNYWISQPTIANLLDRDRFQLHQFRAKKDVKPLLLAGFELHQKSDNTNSRV